MHEEIRGRLATLNSTWQRYAKALEQQLDTVPMDALNRDYLTAWEGLDACGIAEWMLVYDPRTMTFSLPKSGEIVDADLTAVVLSTPTDTPADG